MAARALLFDADGTLWDSYPWYASVLAGLASGSSATALHASLIAGGSVVRLAKDRAVSDKKLLRACVENVNALPLFPGVRETLVKLRERGTPCGVVTSLPGRLVVPLLDGLHLTAYFGTVVHAGSARPPKPHPAPLFAAAQRLSIGALGHVFYIGDSVKDAEAARRAGMHFACAGYGYGGDVQHAVTLRAFAEVLDL